MKYSFTTGKYLKSLTSPYTPNFDSTNSLVVGNTLFPMLYIYYMHRERINRITRPDLFQQAITTYITNQNPNNQDPAKLLKKFNDLVQSYSDLLDNAIHINTNFVWQLTNACSTLMQTYRGRLAEERPRYGSSYYQNSAGTSSSYFPVLDAASPNAADNAMESLRILFENGVITSTHDLGIRPVNLYDGSFAEENAEFLEMQQTMRVLGIPTQGIFTVNKIPKTSPMYHTFSGIDMYATASLASTVSELNGLTNISWSIHRGAQTHRKLGTPAPSGRAKGSRTIAGTMIFVLTDHHPLHDIIPDSYPIQQNTMAGSDPEFWKPLLLSDEIPPFDLVVVMQNEYGFASIVTLYGIEIVDEGASLGIDNMINELVVQYTAVAMDPIIQAKPDEHGNIDVYGLMNGKTSEFWRRREIVIGGSAYTDLETAFQAQYDTIFAEVAAAAAKLQSYSR